MDFKQINQRLADLNDAAKRQGRLELQIRTQEGRVFAQEQTIKQLERAIDQDANEVERWKGSGGHIVVAKLIRRLDQRIAEAENQHRSSIEKREQARRELAQMQARLEELREEMTKTGDAQAERERLLCEKEDSLVSGSHPRSEEFRELSEQLADAQTRLRATGLAQRSLTDATAGLTPVSSDLGEFFMLLAAKDLARNSPSPAPAMANAQQSAVYAKKVCDQLRHDLAQIGISCDFSAWDTAYVLLGPIQINVWGSWSNAHISDANEVHRAVRATIAMVEHVAEDLRWRVREVEKQVGELKARRQAFVETLE